jgi:2-succinyl-6-hydroxy-2,4-cyclohexadiene-1-carboxylate synthase
MPRMLSRMLLALHGYTENDLTWRDVVGAVPGGLRCELLPGHGWKPSPPGDSLTTLISQLARSLPSGGCDLLGYSMGGRICLQLALEHPGLVRRLILISCHAGIRDPRSRQLRRLRDEHLAQMLEEDGIGPFVSWWQNNPALRPVRAAPRADAESLRSVRLNQDPIGLAGALRHFGAGAFDDLWPRLGTLVMPTLLVAGAADTSYCEQMAEMSRLIPRATFATIAEAGHAVHREQHAHLARRVADFLAQHAASG